MDLLTKHRKAGDCDENIKGILEHGKPEVFGVWERRTVNVYV